MAGQAAPYSSQPARHRATRRQRYRHCMIAYGMELLTFVICAGLSTLPTMILDLQASMANSFRVLEGRLVRGAGRRFSLCALIKHSDTRAQLTPCHFPCGPSRGTEALPDLRGDCSERTHLAWIPSRGPCLGRPTFNRELCLFRAL